jgi:hypothetical protein
VASRPLKDSQLTLALAAGTLIFAHATSREDMKKAAEATGDAGGHSTDGGTWASLIELALKTVTGLVS